MTEDILNKIEEEIAQINKKTPSNVMSFVRGIYTGFGYVLGAGLAIILIGWILNAVGVVPAFNKQANEWKLIFQKSQQQTFVPVESTDPVIEK